MGAVDASIFVFFFCAVLWAVHSLMHSLATRLLEIDGDVGYIQ